MSLLSKVIINCPSIDIPVAEQDPRTKSSRKVEVEMAPYTLTLERLIQGSQKLLHVC